MRFRKLYLLLLISSYLIGAYLWEPVVHKRLYVCTDYVPILSFIEPSFVHGETTGDYYIAKKGTVYVVYGSFLAVILTLPAIIALLLLHKGFLPLKNS